MDYDDKVMKMDSGSTKHEIMVPVDALEQQMLKYCNVGNGCDDVSDGGSDAVNRTLETSIDDDQSETLIESLSHLLAIYEEAEGVHNVEDEDGWETWLGDTGASCHVTYNGSMMTNVVTDV